MSDHILIVEDAANIADLLTYFLQESGFTCHACQTGEAALEYIKQNSVDLMILDITLPGINGVIVLHRLRAFSNLPVIMMTARTDERDRLMGFESGADDYVCKPIYPTEMVQRVKSILRRVHNSPPIGSTADARISLLPDQLALQLGEHTIELTDIEYRLIEPLITHPARIFDREQLLLAAYGDDNVRKSQRTIDSHLRKIRQKLAPFTDTPLIESVYGVGYRLRG